MTASLKPLAPVEHPASAIIATGSALPHRCVTNEDLEQHLDTSDAWISERVGIKSRHICSETESCVSLAIEASEKAMNAANLGPDDIDLVIFATVTPDKLLPSAAALLANKMGIQNAMAFDLAAACSGFLFALSTADALLANLAGGHALVIGAESLSRVVDWKDRNTAVLFGDGAGACILQQEPGSTSPILASYLKTDASAAPFIERKAGAFPKVTAPATNIAEVDEADSPFIKMAGREVFKNGVRHMSDSINKVLAEANVTIEDIKLFIPHQSNARMIQSVADGVGLKSEQIALNIERVGNTSAASVPIALDEYVRAGSVSKGDLVLLTAVGSGMTYGSILLRW